MAFIVNRKKCSLSHLAVLLKTSLSVGSPQPSKVSFYYYYYYYYYYYFFLPSLESIPNLIYDLF